MRKGWVWVLGVVALGAIGGVVWWCEGPVAVSVVAPTRGPAVDAIYATGTVEPTVMLPIAPRVAGRVVELSVDEGSRVRKGQVLARLDDADLASTVEELEARARYAQSQYERVIIRRDGEMGQFIPAGQAVFYLSCCAPLRVTAEVDEEDIARVHVGQKVVMRADALPGEVLDGKVGEITPKGDPIARSYRVRVKLADPSQLKVGMTVDANLIVAERPNALLIPATAIQNSAVWIVNEGRLHRQPVRAGVSGAGRTEIVEGLTADARIVDSPASNLREGRAVRLLAPPDAAKK